MNQEDSQKQSVKKLKVEEPIHYDQTTNIQTDRNIIEL